MTLRFSCTHRYGSAFGLDVCFEAPNGVTAICGPSGSGKTTVVLLIAGLVRPDSGRIVLDDSVLVDTAEKLWLPPERRHVGVVFQDSLLFPHMTVRENLAYGRKRRPSESPTIEHVADVLELQAILDRRPTTLSGGQARRVALGRALLARPKLLLLDEPVTGLDDELKGRILVFLERILDEWAIPTVLVSHDRGSVAALSQAVVALKEGRIVDAGRSS